MRRLFALPLILTLAGCPPRIDTGADGGGVIIANAEGGIFIRSGAVIEIPAGALDKEVQITVTVVDTGIPEVPMRKRVSFGYRFSPSTLTFKQPVKIGAAYIEDRIPKGVELATLDMRRNTPEDAYLALSAPETSTQFKIVSAKTDRLGLFWATSPESAAVSKLKIEPAEVFLMVNGTQQFTATITDPTGKEISNAAVTWTIVPPRVAKVDSTGLVTALAPGTATLTATAGKVTETVKVYVPGTTPGPQSFLHDNPFPTGNDLYGGAVALGQAFFVGGNATVLARNASGEWSRLFSSPMVTLKAIGGGLTGGAAAAGVSGNSGVLVELAPGSTAPTVKIFPTVEPRALWFDGTHGMAVGYGNDVIVRRAGQWVTEYSPSVETLLSVVGDGAGGFTTIGSRGSLYQFDPVSKTWNSLFQSQLSVLLTAAVVMDVAGTEAWAVGGGKLWKFAGSWTPINLPPTPAVAELTAVAKVNGKLLLAGNALRQGYLLLYDPATAQADAGTTEDGGQSWPGWSSVALRLPQIVRGIFSAGSEAYAVGDFGAIWRYSGGTFEELSHGFYGNVADVGSAVPDGGTEVVAAAVNECTTAACTTRVGKVMIRTAPGVWSQLGAPAPQPFNTPLSSIVVRSPTEIYAGGDGYIFRYTGSAWSSLPITGGPPARINDFDLCGTTMFAVSPTGANFKGAGSLANQQPLGSSDLHGVHCTSATQVWVAADNALFEGRTPRNTTGVNHGFWRTVWSPGPGEAFAFGDARYGVYWDTQQLNVIDSPGGLLPESIHALWGSSIDNLYAVGFSTFPVTFGYALRFDGATWRLIDAGAHRKGTAVSGASNLNVWIGTEGGGVLRGLPP